MLRYFALLCAAAATLVATPGSAASADYYDPGFYMTAMSEGWGPSYREGVGDFAPKSLGGAAIGAGWRFNRFYTVEASYSYVTGSTSYVRISPQTISLDAMGYLPLGRAGRFALFSDVGASAVFIHVEDSSFYSANQSTYDPHVGGGVQFQLNRMFGFRGMLQYQWLGIYESHGAAIASLGLVFRP